MDFVSFIKSNLERSYFENCSLENAVFIGANLANSYFKMQQNLPLEKAQFAESKLENTRFENTNLMYSNFAHATLNQTIFENAIDTSSNDVDEITRLINIRFEKWITETPEMWFWIHNRWNIKK